MAAKITNAAIDQIFMDARTHNYWLDKPVSEETIAELYAMMRMGPTSANCSPARIVFVRSDEAKAKLKPLLMEGNQEKTMAAPVCAIIGHDLEFYEKIPELFPHNPDAKSWFNWSEEFAEQTAFRNGSLQGAYFMIAARALGLDCGPMSGFDQDGVNEAFFGGTTIKSNFLCNIGYGNDAKLDPRSPRLAFGDACQIV
ncbi:Predicted reductase RutE in novel pyrimidine catabolism pathway [Candidatus Phaeomarinobacter ectocarpi]|uniref:Putative NADH dehydrogenase/NAD(P)H nitroreductase BN1012_Phect1624 n=1 Tax=Candidatus Phaeomarinibacter ectocarpi TaxID=1458461 RepID=X5M8X5_9HYPH|nr:malonic semialdehyde reductase [Candidatus Phaeomarinobacter ectocarpi]CDO59838.1 Predicted reductase RutE in novel pyrimidine catabolism pathway [Candidatus Phaeomarinobacter ectocarpi]